MKNYLKWVDFELKRFWKIYAVMLGLVVIGEAAVTILNSNNVRGQVEDALKYGTSIEQMSLLGLTTNSFFFNMPILLCVAILLIYIFATWYREWFGKNTFIVQILLVPFNRMVVYYAKLTVLLLFIGGCIVTQLAMYPFLNALYQSIVPEAARMDGTLLSWIGGSSSILILVPVKFMDFVLLYGVGIAFVLVLFTAIMLERSFRIKGIFLSVIYSILSFMLLLTPLIIDDKVRLYPNEMLISLLVAATLVSIISLVVSTYLLNKKVWV